MSYVELIVVLSIFSLMTSVILFNYGEFQAKVDIKNLAADIALKIVEAQKASLSGKFNAGAVVGWKPSYGVYFDMADKESFIYFADLNNFSGYEAGAEKLDTISITKSNYIDGVNRCTGDTCSPGVPISPLSINFKRPDSSAVFKDSSGTTLTNDFEYIQITIKAPAPKTATAKIKVYPSGRIQIN